VHRDRLGVVIHREVDRAAESLLDPLARTAAAGKVVEVVDGDLVAGAHYRRTGAAWKSVQNRETAFSPIKDLQAAFSMVFWTLFCRIFLLASVS
jgi:hypothetical protein